MSILKMFAIGWLAFVTTGVIVLAAVAVMRNREWHTAVVFGAIILSVAAIVVLMWEADEE